MSSFQQKGRECISVNIYSKDLFENIIKKTNKTIIISFITIGLPFLFLFFFSWFLTYSFEFCDAENYNHLENIFQLKNVEET